ncbi:MAG: cupin domain-containing protein [Chitinophagaceae bacterium]|nr:MAG: cupin domain-containing protein [Chitinophagaceae bacterium]
MKRKNFISALLLALPSISFAKNRGFDDLEILKPKPDKKGFVVKADESRYSGLQSKADDAFLHCKISTRDTNEGLFIQTSTPKVFKEKGGPPPHVHSNEDEIIYIVSGDFIVHIDGKDIPVKTGDTAFIPRGTLHTVINPIENNPGMLMTIFQPAAKKVEDFFGYISKHGEIPKDIIPEGW